MTQNLKLILVSLFSLGIIVNLTSCAPAMFAGATASGMVAQDNRTTGSFIEDQAIEVKALAQLAQQVGDNARYSVVSINRVAMVLGQAPNEEIRNQIYDIVAGQDHVRRVINQVTIGPQITYRQLAKDTFTTSKVITELLKIQKEDFSTLDVKVITEDGIVYLMGLISVDNAAIVIDTARNVSGVRQVVQAFEFLPEV